MEYILLSLLLVHLLLLIFYSTRLYHHKDLPVHRKSFWFFIFLSTPVFGWMLYRNTDGKLKFKKPSQSERPC